MIALHQHQKSIRTLIAGIGSIGRL